ncbi:YesL family protein [Bifidobacterium pullorum]|uniref:YesL family protein n=1 Tax=Bifidobacterium pullorum TaxID=78448 RepID=UPI003AF94657
MFDADNPFNRFMTMVANLLIVNIAWAVCCVPVITIGASTGAMFAVCRRLAAGEEGTSILRTFLGEFRRLFVRSLPVTLILLVFWAIAAFDLWYLSAQTADSAAVVYGMTAVVLALVAAGVGFVMPQLSTIDDMATLQRFRNSFLLALLHPLVALAMLISTLLPVVLALAFPMALIPIVWLWALILSAVTAYGQIRLMTWAFARKPRSRR